MLDVHVDRRANFARMRGYKLHCMLRGLDRAGLRWRMVDDGAGDPGNAAFVHVDLTELPQRFRGIGDRSARAINARAVTIDRRLYSRLRLTPDSDHEGPVIVKTVLNSRGLPELRYRSRANLASRLDHLLRKIAVRGYKDAVCPAYRILASVRDVPAEVWEDERLMVERFAPGGVTLPVVKHRLDFFFDVELNTRAVFASLLCDPESVEAFDVVADVPEAVRRVRRDLNLDYGAIDYFVIDDEAFVIDANKTVTTTESWVGRFPAVAGHVDDVTSRLIEFVRGS